MGKYFSIFLLSSFLVQNTFTDSIEFNTFNNHGVIGLINMPTARLYYESSYGFTLYNGKPDQKTHEYSIVSEEKTLKPTRIPTKVPTPNPAPEPQQPEIFAAGAPASEIIVSPPRPCSFASPARTHDTNTKRNRNRFPGWGDSCRPRFPPTSDNVPTGRICCVLRRWEAQFWAGWVKRNSIPFFVRVPKLRQGCLRQFVKVGRAAAAASE